MTGTFTAGAVLTAANLNTAINSSTLNAQTGAGYTLVLTDAGKLVTVSNASAQNLTIPLNSSVAYATGTTIDVLNIGAGTWTVTATGGVTLTGTTSVPTSARVRLTKTGTDTWYAHASGGGGLTLITASTFSASSAVNINNVFSSTYAGYLVLGAWSSSGSVEMSVRMRVSGTDDSSANYYTQNLNGDATTPASQRYAASTYFRVGFSNTGIRAINEMIFYDPNATSATTLLNRMLQGTTLPITYANAGSHAVSTAYTGFTLYPASGTISGDIRVYGYSNA